MGSVEIIFTNKFAGYEIGEEVSLSHQEATYFVNLAVAKYKNTGCGCGCNKCE